MIYRWMDGWMEKEVEGLVGSKMIYRWKGRWMYEWMDGWQEKE